LLLPLPVQLPLQHWLLLPHLAFAPPPHLPAFTVPLGQQLLLQQSVLVVQVPPKSFPHFPTFAVPLAQQTCVLVQQVWLVPVPHRLVLAQHAPLTHVWPDVQLWPQVPQLLVLLCRLAHVPLQQVSPVAQRWPQAPQLLTSLCRFVHVPLQAVCPVGQQTLLEQTCVALLQQAALPHGVAVWLQVNPHCPLVHVALALATFVVHGWPQAPQLLNVRVEVRLAAVRVTLTGRTIAASIARVAGVDADPAGARLVGVRPVGAGVATCLAVGDVRQEVDALSNLGDCPTGAEIWQGGWTDALVGG
jgi:hypothetical protein